MSRPSELPVEDAAAIRHAYELLATLAQSLPPADGEPADADHDESGDERTAA